MITREAVTKIIKDPYHCNHASIELRERTYSNQIAHYVDQCLRCGSQLQSHKRDSIIVAQAKLNDGIAKFDLDIADRFFSRGRQERKDQRDNERADWQAWYTEYLESEKWKSKRAEVMRRDKFTCQGCHGRATEVHHLTYANVGDELLFQLIALCEDCHQRVHDADK